MDTKRYYLKLNLSKSTDSNRFPELKKERNKRLKQTLLSIRRNFNNDSSIITCKEDIERAVLKIIPASFFGCKVNKKLFMRLVKNILNHRKGEFLHISLLSKNFERNCEWSEGIENRNEFEETLRDVHLYLLEKCVKPFIKRHFFPVSHGKSYRIDLIPKSKWQSFRNRVFQHMISKGHVKLKEKYAFLKCPPRGALRILPKENCDSSSYRPVICYFSKRNKNKTKKDYLRNENNEKNFKYICQIKRKLKVYVREKKLHSMLHKSWEDFVGKSGFSMIYGIKADVKDSFGSINIDKLSWVIQELPKRILSDSEKEFLLKRISKQYITYNNIKKRIIIRWCHGLLQGDRLSSVLCDIYYLVLIDQKLLKTCFVGNFFFHRTVDDYIFCSTNKETVQKFITNITLGHVLNEDKIFSNIDNHTVTELPYCGYIFNLYTKELIIGFNMKKYDMRNKLRLWNDELFSSPDKYLTDIMKFSAVNFYFSKIVFSTHYNHEETIVKIYFQSMIYSAMKFHCAFTELKQYHKNYCRNCFLITKKIIKIVNIYAAKTIKIIEKSKGNLYHGDINYQLLVTLGVRAFILVLHKYYEIYKEVIGSLKKQVLMKINFFGGLDISHFKKIPLNMLVKNQR